MAYHHLRGGRIQKTTFITFTIFIWINTYQISNTDSDLANAGSIVRGNDWNDLYMTQTEKEKLNLFKEKVSEKLPESYMKTDFYLIRWLRARDFDIDKAKIMLFENIKWRKTNRIRQILSEDFSDVADDFPVTTNTHDLKHRPVGTLNLGMWDIRSTVLHGKLSRLFRFIDHFREKIVHQILEVQQNGKQVTRAILLFDLEGFNFYQHLCPSCISVFVRLVSGMESHYPGFWEEIIVVNTPRTFQILLNALQGVMSQQTREVLTIFDTNKNLWVPYLDNRIERSQRYINFGGTKQHEEH